MRGDDNRNCVCDSSCVDAQSVRGAVGAVADRDSANYCTALRGGDVPRVARCYTADTAR